MGAAVVRAFPGLGARVVSMDVAADAGAAIAGEAGAEFVAADVSDPGSVTAAFEAAAGLLGGLDVLVHAAGIAPSSAAEESTAELFRRVLDVNALGTMLANQAAFRLMKDAGGTILNFASAAGVAGQKNKSVYSMSKGAVVAWTRTAAKEWGGYGIRVNMIAPAIRTPMYEKTRSEMTPQGLAAHDAGLRATVLIGGRLGDPDRDFIPVLAFQSSEGAGFMTGQLIAVDGGILMAR